MKLKAGHKGTLKNKIDLLYGVKANTLHPIEIL